MKRRRSGKARSSGTERLDRISALPQHLIEEILLRLPLKDAVRTSVLSSKWREKWTTLPEIVFDDCYNQCSGRSTSGKFVKKAIDTIFCYHSGPVKVFKLFLGSNYPENSDILRWIRHLSRLSISKLEIHDGFGIISYNLGSCLFACNDLVSLDLKQCSFRLPSNFIGLKNLINLTLRPALVAQDMLENLISSCPRLMKLDIAVLSDDSNLRFSHLTISALSLQYLVVHGCLKTVKIDAPNLQHLDLECLLEDIDVNTSCLLSLRLFHSYCWGPIHEKADAMCRCVVKLFVRQSQLKYVDLDHHFIQYLSLSGFSDKLCNSLVHVKHLKVSLKFISLEDVSATLCLIRSCPTIESIVFCQEMYRNDEGNASSVSKFLEDYSSSCLFNQLKNVWIRWMSNNVAETSILKFVMSRSPILENMVITPLSAAAEGGLDLPRQLEQCPRPNRALVFCINGRDGFREPIKEPAYSLDQKS